METSLLEAILSTARAYRGAGNLIITAPFHCDCVMRLAMFGFSFDQGSCSS
jgi:hypothetical protein